MTENVTFIAPRLDRAKLTREHQENKEFFALALRRWLSAILDAIHQAEDNFIRDPEISFLVSPELVNLFSELDDCRAMLKILFPPQEPEA